MKKLGVILALVGLLPAYGEVVGKLGASADLPTSDGWTFAGRTEIPEEKMTVWTSRNPSRRESIQFCVLESDTEASLAQKATSSWEAGLIADGKKEVVAAKDIEISGRKARYVVARWKGRAEPFFHFVLVVEKRHMSFFSIVAPSDSELGGEVAATCVRSLHIASPNG